MITKLARVLISGLLSVMLSGCASTLLHPHELAAKEQRDNANAIPATKAERYAAGYMARYGLDPDERQEFLEEIAEDSEFVETGRSVLNEELEFIVADQLFDHFSDEAVKLALKNNMSMNAGIGIGFIGSLIVSDLLFSQSGVDYVGGINLPAAVDGEILDSEERANDYIGRFIQSRMAIAAKSIGYKVNSMDIFNRPQQEEVPPIDTRVFWLVPQTNEPGAQPATEDLVVMVVNMHVQENKLETISPLLTSSLGFLPVYSTPEKYTRAFGVTFLEKATVSDGDWRYDKYSGFSTSQKRNLVKSLVGENGYLYRGEFRTSFNSGNYLSFKGQNYAQEFRRADSWLEEKLDEPAVGIFRPEQ